MKPILQASHLVKRFGSGHTRVTAVHDITFTLHAGEVLLVMGPSGSGKTTLLSLLGGLLSVDSGNILYGDHDITAMKHRDALQLRARYTGFVFQSFNLMPTLNAWENVAIVPQLLNLRKETSRQDAQRLLCDLGLGKRLDYDIRHLSGGEQQRVSIARALITNPKLIIADEPTANLDSKNGHKVVQLLRAAVHGQERAIIVASHDERIREFADRILLLEDGHLR